MTSLCPLNFFSAGKVLLSSGGTFLLPRCHIYGGVTNGVKCHAIYNPFAGRYFVDDVYGVIRSSPDRDSR